MAVPTNQSFDYEVLATPSADGHFVGSAASVQEREGALPGLLGSTPRLDVHADELVLEALPTQMPAASAWQWLFIFLFPLRNRWLDGQLRRASVKSIRITVPGMSAVLRAGQTLRVRLQFDPNTGVGPTPRVDVTLLTDQSPVQRWDGLAMHSEPIAWASPRQGL